MEHECVVTGDRVLWSRSIVFLFVAPRGISDLIKYAVGSWYKDIKYVHELNPIIKV